MSINTKVAGPAPYSFSNVHYIAAGATLFGTTVKGAYEYAAPANADARVYTARNAYSSHGGNFSNCEQCHMGSNSLHPDYKSHNVAKPNPNNCICHFGDVSQTPGDFDFANIRPATGIGSTDYDADADVTESLKSEIQGLEAQLYAAIRAYATGTVGRSIAYSPAAYPYWFYDANNNGVVDGGEVAYGTNFDARLLKACYNYNYSIKEPNACIHNPLYIAQILHDSARNLDGGVDLAWR